MKVLISMSGGVDSSVAAEIMAKNGYDCIGAYMYLHRSRDLCEKDVNDARKIAEKLKFQFVTFDFTDDFETFVVADFAESYFRGETPNPCINCNRLIKWKLMFREMEKAGADFVVTGHYARIRKNADGSFSLLKGKDAKKDQSYVLYNMTQEELAHTLLPLGEYSKDEIRKIALESGFENAERRDSQDICFIPDGNYAEFIENYTERTSPRGNFVDIDGNVIGKHNGIIHYTVGQRKGLGVAFGKPVYVIDKNADSNTVTLADEEYLFKTEVTAQRFNWISGKVPETPIFVTAKTRYNGTDTPATVTEIYGDIVKIQFEKPVRAVTKGQSLVLYSGEEVLGGGIIK